jgi:DNA-binding CsgD family transcriptional regulator
MDQKRLARLTEQQRICLRYVYLHMTSKEIAPLMRSSPARSISISRRRFAFLGSAIEGRRQVAGRI